MKVANRTLTLALSALTWLCIVHAVSDDECSVGSRSWRSTCVRVELARGTVRCAVLCAANRKPQTFALNPKPGCIPAALMAALVCTPVAKTPVRISRCGVRLIMMSS